MKSDILLQQTANILLTHLQYSSHLGLITGKMGQCLFFYVYSKYSGCTEYREIAEELLDLTLSKVEKLEHIDFQNGLSGIGWGIHYLLKNGYVKGDPEEVLAEFDRMEPLLCCSYALPSYMQETYVIPHLYLLQRGIPGKKGVRHEVVEKLAETTRQIKEEDRKMPVGFWQSAHYFFHYLKITDRAHPDYIAIQASCTGPFESVIDCDALEELGALSWQAVVYGQKIRIPFTEEQLITYINGIARNMDPEDVTMNGFLGIGWGLLHSVYEKNGE